jgi:hypothetical protein
VAVAVQLKQLAAFSLPGLMALGVLAVDTVRRRRDARWRVAAALVPLAVVGGVVLGLDRLVFQPPPGHSGILSYVWTTGAYHVGYLSNNGPSLWTFFARANRSPSSTPLLGSLTPVGIGEGLYVAVLTLVGAALAAALWHVRASTDARRPAMAAWCLWVTGLGNLLMGILLAGTHERHAVHAFPFLFTGLLGLRATRPPAGSALWLVALGLTAGAYGVFVLSILYEEVRITHPSWAAQAVTAGILAIAGAGLTAATLRHLAAESRAPVP